jgi:hypothetical protein
VAAGRIIRGIGRGLLALAVALFLVLLAMALHFQLAGPLRQAALAGVALVAGGLAVLWWRRRAAFWGLLLATVAVSAVWYGSIRPSNDRVWAPDVEFGVTGTLAGDVVTLYHVRDFDWSTPETFTGGWETREYRLSQLTSVDLISSVWANPAIAHTLMSFGFADGTHVVFSAEIRKQKGEAFTALGGFFRKFDLVLIAADERDILRLRTDVRREMVSLYRLTAPQELMQRMFLNYVTLGNDLAAHPRFYNTATTNCTTVIWQMAREVDPGLPFDYRVALSGWIAGYLQSIGLLPADVPLEVIEAEARVPPVGPAGNDSAAFSARLRAGMGRAADRAAQRARSTDPV